MDFSEKITDRNFIEKLIPQKFPFVMVDKLLEFGEREIRSGFSVNSENILVENGFFSEAGLIENMAQTSALHTGCKHFDSSGNAPTGYIGSIKKVEIFDLPKVGEELETTVILLHEIMGVTVLTAQVECNGKIMAQCEMKTVLAV
ncbi:hypothetical protein [Aequorivita echinoideorum]|uniref:3-hydroxymyristoyl/3-hydroxydecanoyl-(Acyl carrier protein) dehydratase n=1 Tax=Aequorivita echinoideorum TaxID=1549647 RepID=A0ABS5S3G8_9FLAO|nr:hypothetical protein [Aequorivita echinoideorum]MBT0607751.1 hypothetical protein [Aequorivita echinoideorum]